MPRRFGVIVLPILAALTLAGCVGAQAAQGNGPHGPPEPGANWYPTHTHWDDVATCESGNNWGYNGPSGFDGGLQFLPSTWTGAGGGQFAPYAYMASRHAQITVAERLQPGAWPNCYR